MTGMNKIPDKEKRKQRRNYERNSIAHDLGSPKYHQRIIPKKHKEDKELNYDDE